MPCTLGGAPVMIEMLFGLVKLGITDCARQTGAGLHQPGEIGREPRLDRSLDIAGLRAVDADDDGGALGK